MRPLRPLPSINIPLLREERSALRSRRALRLLLIAAALLGGAALAAIAFISGPSEQESDDHGLDAEASEQAGVVPADTAPVLDSAPSASPSEPSAPAAVLAATPKPEAPQPNLPPADPRASSRSQRSFGQAVSFKDALEKNGLSRDEANQVITGLTPVMDFRRSQPDDTLIMERDSSGGLVRFEYRSGLTQRYEARRADGGSFEGRQIQVPIRHERVAKGGTVDGSLGDALEGLKLGRSLAGVFAEVFEGKVNFSTDTRAGDTFRIIFDEDYVEDTFLRYGTIHAIEFRGAKAGHLTAFWHSAKGEDGDFYDATGRALHGGWLRTPLRYDHISSGFGMRLHPVLKRKKLHNGIDYAAGSGTPVRAAASGTITFIGPKGPNGNLLAISHAQGYETFYAHLSRFSPGLKKGSKVEQRQVIAYVGSTGRSTGPHLHFSLKRSGNFLDPATQLNGPGLPMASKDLPEFKRQVREFTSALERVAIERPAPVTSNASHDDPLDLGEEEL
ncbi:MAG: peptidoglycan DD-metalloendopeptidase family protein [Myxococcales bacterium]